MLKIRLARVGRKKRPSFRFIVSDSLKDTYGKALEIVGHYDPFSKVCEVKADRIKYWLSKGAQPSPTVHNMLVDQNVISGEKVKAGKSKKKKGEPEQPVQAAPAAPAAAESAPAAQPVSETTAEPAPAEEKPADEAPAPEAEEKKE